MLENFIGQERIKQQIAILIQQSKESSLPHIGLFARAGMGKTLLAHIIADETNSKLIYLNGTAVRDPITFLTEVYKAKDAPHEHFIVFIDEAHTLPKKIQENLLSVLEEPAMLCFVAPKTMPFKNAHGDVEMRKKGQSVRVKVPKNISFILGTTNKGDLKDTIRSRIISIDLDDYEEQDCVTILKRSSKRKLPEKAYIDIARIGKNNRIMKQYLVSFESFLNLRMVSDNEIAPSHFKEFCDINGIGADGCDKTDIKYMQLLHMHRKIGLNSMSAMLQVDIEEVKKITEPWLMQKGYIRITPRGRELTSEGIERIGHTVVNNVDGLFEIGDD